MSEDLKDLKIEEPTLSFDTGEVPKAPESPAVSQKPEMTEQETALTPEEQKQVDAFVDKIDLHSSQGILNYGVGTQKKMADFSEKALSNVRTKDLGEVGAMVSDLVTQLKSFEIDENTDRGARRFFKKRANRLTALKAQYAHVESNVVTIQKELEKHQVTLMKDAAMMDRMYEMNLNYFKELTMYIAAGKKKLQLTRDHELADLQAKASASGLPEDAQAAKDLAGLCDRFEKKLYDLQLTRTIALQTGPQIRMVQNSDTLMAEKIQSTIVNTIPLWKNQMVIAIGVEHSTQAAKVQREVSDMTNELLKKNADALKSASVETAKESERGIVDIETLKHTNESLISTLDEILNIQQEGKTKRREAEKELSDIENQLKQKLLEASRR